MTRLVLSLMVGLLLCSCSSLKLSDTDNGNERTKKVTTRAVMAIPTFGISEIPYALMKSKWEKIRPGKTREEVIDIVGEPTERRQENPSASGGQEVWVYDFGEKGKRTVTLEDGVVKQVLYE